jgi:PAS domain S-box-containing protein
MHSNDRGFAVLGIPVRPEGLPITEVRRFVHPDDLPRVLASAQQALRSDRPTDMEARYRRSNGTWRHVLTRRVVQRAPDGTPLAFLGVALDVTEQVERARAAADLSQRLDMAAIAAGIGVWSRDVETEEGVWNAQMYTLCGRSPTLPPPTRREWLDEIVHADDRALMEGARAPMLTSAGDMFEHEYRIVRPDGEVRWMVDRARSRLWNGHTTILGVTLDVTERRRTAQALRSADERAALAARSAGIGTWEIDLDGSGVERWDEQMFRLRGLAPQAQPPTREQRLALVHPDDRARNVDARIGALGDTRLTRYEFRVILPDGSERWLASRSMPVLDEQGKVRRRIGVNWDVTDAKDAELARQQTAVAERASQAKSQFLARMSHELRTPLNAVLGFAQLLQIEADAQAATDRAAKLGHIRAAGEHLLTLIDGMLDLSGLEAGSLKLDLQPIALADIVEQVLPLVTAQAQRGGVALHTGVLAGAVQADRTRLVQVLVNLLSNAIKYNRRGGSVSITALPDAASVCIVVSDTGRGMTADQLAHLFEPFNRLGIEREGIQGTGIGLTIVKALVTGMGGTVAVRSRTGEGTTVELRLPSVAQATAVAGAGSAPLHPDCSARGGQLLYIEDNAVNVLLVEELVRNLSGLRIASEPTGAAGVARARELRPDLVLVDMQLPDFDGFEVLRRLRAAPETAAIDCIALSANAMPEDIERALKAGFADYWTKPIDFSAFLAALQQRFPSERLEAG